ncbi:MAG: DUF1858 domain-containing protein [Candidatus Tectomicrobia bacterium]|uniref:DUF1858 domain-containing protein n=1 Tax=Tectimicrobiota bacterium TaxID=2528274 RepID=A0A932FZM4_UNCTE|nr:DUF1858 domain-containing protein [Candidatus Tectomicrobia bacterium]
MSHSQEITSDAIIGDVIQNYPGSEKIIEKYFGNGCFTCPGMKLESIAFGATMHGIDPDPIIQELNALIEKREG